MERRNFMRTVVAGSTAMGASMGALAAVDARAPAGGERAYMAGLLQKMAEPVLSNTSLPLPGAAGAPRAGP